MKSQEHENNFVKPSQSSTPENSGQLPTDPQLSEAWRELLGLQSEGTTGATPHQPPKEAAIPALPDDPWSSLVHAKGNEVVDLQRVHLDSLHAPLSDQDVEQALQVMQEKPADDTTNKK